MESENQSAFNASKSSELLGECREAVALAVGLLSADEVDIDGYKLTAAVNVLKGSARAGPHTWRLTFKPERLIPATSGAEIGAGGELFVEVDVATGTADLVGYGE